MQAITKGEREVNPSGGQQQQLNRTRAGLGRDWDLRSTVRIYLRIAKRLYICCVYMLELPVCSKRFHCDNCNNAIGNGREDGEEGRGEEGTDQSRHNKNSYSFLSIFV